MMVGRDVVLTVNNARKQQVESEIMYKAENLTTVNDYGKIWHPVVRFLLYLMLADHFFYAEQHPS